MKEEETVPCYKCKCCKARIKAQLSKEMKAMNKFAGWVGGIALHNTFIIRLLPKICCKRDKKLIEEELRKYQIPERMLRA